jgi:hypothetical protein
MIGCSENWRGSRPYRSAPVLGRSNWLHSFTRKSRGRSPDCKAPEGWRSPGRFAYFRNHRVAHSVLECGGHPPLFPEAYPTMPMLTGTAIVFPDHQGDKPHTLAKRHEKNISGDSCILWFKAFPSSIFQPPSFMLPSCISGRSPSSASACSAAPSGWPSDAGNSRA